MREFRVGHPSELICRKRNDDGTNGEDLGCGSTLATFENDYLNKLATGTGELSI
jgi:hypothetical protein